MGSRVSCAHRVRYELQLVTTTTVTPQGSMSLVRISTAWEGGAAACCATRPTSARSWPCRTSPDAADPGAVPLELADVPEMLDLARRTKPGPFLSRTVAMGNYLGIRYGGALVAMAGERLHPSGWTEISAVCTDAAWRRRGLASRLVLAVAAGIRARGETPFLHAVASNVNAIRLYEQLGFRLRRSAMFSAARGPENQYAPWPAAPAPTLGAVAR